MNLKAIVPLILIGSIALTGCSSGESQPGSESESPSAEVSSEAPTPLGEMSFATVTELKDALVAEGFPCPEWIETNQVKLAATSGTCDDSSVLSVYTSNSAKEDVIQNLKSFTGDFGGHLVVGENWILNTADNEVWAEKLGAMPVSW